MQVREQARSASASEVQVKDLDEHKLNGMDEEQLLRERREGEGESGGTGRESESEPDTDEREGEERGEMSGETRERARASASQERWTSGSTSGGASGGARAKATTNVGGHKATDHMTGCNVLSCGRRDSSSDGRGCSCPAHSSGSGRNSSKSNTSDSRTETEAKEFRVLRPDRQPRGSARQHQDARTSCARPMDSSASQLEKEACSRVAHPSEKKNHESHKHCLSAFGSTSAAPARWAHALTNWEQPFAHRWARGRGADAAVGGHGERVVPKGNILNVAFVQNWVG
jgi:hypothetical protein